MKDKYNIEMEDISPFPIERSDDYQLWEPVTQQEIEQLLARQTLEKAKTFLGVVRNGGLFRLQDHYYRIKSA
jgi:hypothetical protein